MGRKDFWLVRRRGMLPRQLAPLRPEGLRLSNAAQEPRLQPAVAYVVDDSARDRDQCRCLLVKLRGAPSEPIPAAGGGGGICAHVGAEFTPRTAELEQNRAHGRPRTPSAALARAARARRLDRARQGTGWRQSAAASSAPVLRPARRRVPSVSYTHLTLPTIYSV